MDVHAAHPNSYQTDECEKTQTLPSFLWSPLSGNVGKSVQIMSMSICVPTGLTPLLPQSKTASTDEVVKRATKPKLNSKLILMFNSKNTLSKPMFFQRRCYHFQQLLFPSINLSCFSNVLGAFLNRDERVRKRARARVQSTEEGPSSL